MAEKQPTHPKSDDSFTPASSAPEPGAMGSGVSVGGNVSDSNIVTGDNNIIFNRDAKPAVRVVYNIFGTRPDNLEHSVPRQLWDQLSQYFGPRRHILFVILGVEVVVAGLFLYFRHHYLLSPWEYVVFSSFLALTLWSWNEYTLTKERTEATTKAVVAVAFSIALAGVFGRQIWPKLFPPPIAEDKFGIAVAVFGEGSRYGASHRGYEVADRIYAELKTAIENHGRQSENQQNRLEDRIELRRIGVVGTTSDDADRVGSRIDADLVIWGQIVVEGKSLRIHFEALGGPELIDNPDAAMGIPFTPVMLEGLFTLPYDAAEGFGSIVADDRLAMAAFSLGLFHYFERDWVSAEEQFAIALERLHADPSNAETVESDREPLPTGSDNLGLIYYYLGKSRQLLGKYETSDISFESAIKHGMNEPALWLARAHNFELIGLEQDRLDALETAVELTRNVPAKMAIPAANNRALAHEAGDQYADALNDYQFILAEDNEFFTAYLGAARSQIELEAYSDAADMLDQAEQLIGAIPERLAGVHLLRGRLAHRQGDTATAIAEYVTASEPVTGDMAARAFAPLTALYAEEGDAENVIHYGKRLIDASPAGAWSHATYGRYLHDVGEHALAIDELEKALVLRPTNTLAHYRLALSYWAISKEKPSEYADRIEEHFLKALEHPGEYEAAIRAEYGRFLHTVDRLDEAIKQLETSINLVDRDAEAVEHPAIVTRYNLSIFYELSDRPDDAIEMFRSIVTHCVDEYPEELNYAVERLQLYEEPVPPCHLVEGRQP